MKNITPSIRVAFVLEGSYTVDQQGVFSRSGARRVHSRSEAGIKAQGSAFQQPESARPRAGSKNFLPYPFPIQCLPQRGGIDADHPGDDRATLSVRPGTY